MVLQKPLTAIFAAFLLLLLEPYTLAFPSLKFASCCYSLSKDVVPNPVGSYIAGLNTLESTVGGIARKQIVLYDGISCGFCYRSSCRYLSLSSSSWERQKLNRPRKQAIGLDFSCGAFCISTPGPYDGGRSWRRWQGVVYAVMKHVIPLIPQRTLHLIACVTAVELAKNEAKVQIEALPLELQPKAKVLFNDSASLVSSYMLQLMDMDWDVSRLVMQEWEAWRNRSENGIAISASLFASNELEHSPPGPGIIARDAARLYREVTVMDLVTWTNNIRSFLESTVSRLLTQVAKTDQDALDSAVVKKLETQGASALTVSEFFDLCSGGRVPKQYIENLLCIFVQDDVESPSTHLHHHQTISSGGSEMCELALHEMWDKLKLQSSKGQVAITRAATDAVRSLRSNSIVLVRVLFRTLHIVLLIVIYIHVCR